MAYAVFILIKYCKNFFLHTTSSLKWGRGGYSNIQLVSSLYPLVPYNVTHKIDNRDNWHDFPGGRQFRWKCSMGNELLLCVDTKLKSIEAGDEPVLLTMKT